MNFRYQRGNSLFVIIVIILISCMFLLHSLHYQLDNALVTMGDEQRYLRAYNQALSSLNWGLTIKWTASELSWEPAGPRSKIKWNCQDPPPGQEFMACIKPAKASGVFLLKGESQEFQGQRLAIYQRVKSERQDELGWTMNKMNKSKVIPIDKGMLDFCPEKNENHCH